MTGTDTPVQVTEFLNGPYLDYARYVLYLRAIPNVIDGLKPGQRKAVYTASKTAKTKIIKTAALGGYGVAMANFHHGEGNLAGAVNLMAATWRNNVCLFRGEGNFGSRLVNEAGATRYTHVQLADAFDQYFLDTEITERCPDPEDPEPKFYLPLIPFVLVNPVEGMAIGFRTEIQPRHPKLLRKACSDYLSGKVTREQLIETRFPPHYPDFEGEVRFREEDCNWVTRGKFERTGKTTVLVTELPVRFDREKYVEVLDRLEEKGKITSYRDECAEGKFRFSVRFPASADHSDEQVIKTLSLEAAVTDILTTIDENGALRIFSSVGELVAHFCDYRLAQYPKRFAAWLARDLDLQDKARTRLRFIQAVIGGLFKFVGCSRDQLRKQMTDAGFPSHHHEMLLGTRTSEFTQERIDELQREISDLVNACQTWSSAVPREWYLRELSELRC